jgi:hypothetical protein
LDALKGIPDMPASRDSIEQLAQKPTEGLARELKGWLDPRNPGNMWKILSACMALRNQDGGLLFIGYDDETGEPKPPPPTLRPRTHYHVDKLQPVIVAHSSEQFEITVHFPEVGGHEHPVIEVPHGVASPVALKREYFIMKQRKGKKKKDVLAYRDSVYVRSLASNGRASTTKATYEDWPALTRRCLDNREADLGRFLRRHFDEDTLRRVAGTLLGETLRHLVSHPSLMSQTDETAERGEHRLDEWIGSSNARLNVVAGRIPDELSRFGAWQVSAVVDGNVPDHDPDSRFLDLLSSSNPNLTGWPPWLDSRPFSDEDTTPTLVEGVYETLVSTKAHVDFMRMDPRGRFFLWTGLEDDMAQASREPRTVLEFGLVVLRVTEAMVVAQEYAKAMGCDPESCTLRFAFAWDSLAGRTLSNWADPGRYLRREYKCRETSVHSRVAIPLATPSAGLASFVQSTTRPLFGAFQGFEFSLEAIEDLVARLLERRL